MKILSNSTMIYYFGNGYLSFENLLSQVLICHPREYILVISLKRI
jgi:hypothetical protein